jgi:hypothetical protein
MTRYLGLPLRSLTLALIFLAALAGPLDSQAIAPGDSAFERTWSRTDLPVASGAVSRTWMWGPAAFTGPMTEWMTDNPGNGRLVQYFDKSRMEITDPSADPDAIWYVTNGLLARELVSGELQLGLNDFETRQPALINVAGDSADPNAPTYASFQALLDAPPRAESELIATRVDRQGNLVEDASLLERGVAATEFVTATNHRIAAPFWEFMNSSGVVFEDGQNVDAPLFETPFFATGLPITEAYWAAVAVNGIPQDVLVQVFERRVLTYTPNNASAWQVEAGNVGRHYFEWRYTTEPPIEPLAPAADASSIGPSPLPTFSDRGGVSRLTIANHAPQPLVITFEGIASQTIELPPCESCLSANEPPSACAAEAPATTIDLAPGNYLVTSQRPEGDAPSLSGPWTLLPDAGYGACFFVIVEG